MRHLRLALLVLVALTGTALAQPRAHYTFVPGALGFAPQLSLPPTCVGIDCTWLDASVSPPVLKRTTAAGVTTQLTGGGGGGGGGTIVTFTMAGGLSCDGGSSCDDSVSRTFSILNSGIGNAKLQNPGVTIPVNGPITGGGAVVLGASTLPLDCPTCVLTSGIGASVQAFDPDLSAIAQLATVGFPARIASNTWAQRTLVPGTAISITFPDGVGGNPVIGNTGVAQLLNGPGVTFDSNTGTITPTINAVRSLVASTWITPSAANGDNVSLTFNGLGDCTSGGGAICTTVNGHMTLSTAVGGGASGTLDNISIDTLKGKAVATPTTKGDEEVYNGTAFVRHPAGANETINVNDSTQPDGKRTDVVNAVKLMGTSLDTTVGSAADTQVICKNASTGKWQACNPNGNTYTGAWSSSTTYFAGAVVQSTSPTGELFISLQDGNLNNTPDSTATTAWWRGFAPDNATTSSNAQTMTGKSISGGQISSAVANATTAVDVSTTINGKAFDTPTTKGDIWIYNGTQWKRIGVGSDGQVLTLDSAQSLGAKWATVSAGATPNPLHAGTGLSGSDFDGSLARTWTLDQAVSPIWTATHIFRTTSIATAQTPQLTLQNNTAAANNAQQFSPIVELEGRGWATSGSASQAVKWGLQTRPVQGTAAAAELVFWESLNGGAYAEIAKLTATGWPLASIQGTAVATADSRLAPTPTAAGKLLVDTGSTYHEGPACGTNTVMHGAGAADYTCSTIATADIAAGAVDLTTKVTGVDPIANGGTNSSTALTGNWMMVSNSGGTAIVEGNIGDIQIAEVTSTTTGGAAVDTTITLPTARGTNGTNGIAIHDVRFRVTQAAAGGGSVNVRGGLSAGGQELIVTTAAGALGNVTGVAAADHGTSCPSSRDYNCLANGAATVTLRVEAPVGTVSTALKGIWTFTIGKD